MKNMKRREKKRRRKNGKENKEFFLLFYSPYFFLEGFLIFSLRGKKGLFSERKNQFGMRRVCTAKRIYKKTLIISFFLRGICVERGEGANIYLLLSPFLFSLSFLFNPTEKKHPSLYFLGASFLTVPPFPHFQIAFWRKGTIFSVSGILGERGDLKKSLLLSP
jgi:hypothetical protein